MSMASPCRIHSPAIATPALRPPMELALRPNDQKPAMAMPPSTLLPIPASTDHIPAPTKMTHVQPVSHSKSVDIVDGDINGRSAIKTESTDPFFRTFRLYAALRRTPHYVATSADNRTPHYVATSTESYKHSQAMTVATSPQHPHRPIAGPAKLTIQSTPVKSQPPMLSSNLSSQNKGQQATMATTTPITLPSVGCDNDTNGHGNGNSTKPMKMTASMATQNHFTTTNQMQSKSAIILRTHNHGGREYHSSSDENRSSGHASMSDTGHGSSSPGCGNNHHRVNGTKLGTNGFSNASEHVVRKNSQDARKHSIGTRCNESRSRHKVPWNGTGLEDVKLAIQQLTMRSQTSTSTYSSLSAGSESSEPVRRLGRYSSLETVNTNVTNADE